MKNFILIFAVSLFVAACGNTGNKPESKDKSGHDEHGEKHTEEVLISTLQFESLDMKVGKLPLRNITTYVEANGQLEVPPQNEASVTAIIGANVKSIEVIEGDKVKEGQALARLSHPQLIKMQSDYLNEWNRLQFLEKEHSRQKRLYEEKVGSGKDLQKTASEYRSASGMVRGYEAKLKLLGLNPVKIRQDRIYDHVSVVSPIDGYIRLVEVKTGQYVEPQTEMFEIVNLEHIHADLMVFEKDMHRVRQGQKVKFTIESVPGKELEASIYSVGKSFEQNPKAIHIHAEIENKQGLLIPGMYVRGRIITDNAESYALPEAGVVREGERYYMFRAEKKEINGEINWAFEPLEIVTGTKDNGWVEIKLLNASESEIELAWNNAYYLMAEMKKGEAEHSH